MENTTENKTPEQITSELTQLSKKLNALIEDIASISEQNVPITNDKAFQLQSQILSFGYLTVAYAYDTVNPDKTYPPVKI